jgi:hypothetical protein
MQLRGANVKQQSLWAWLGLVIITLGIYQLFWYYRVNRETKDVGAAWGDAELGASSPGMSALAMFIPIANLVSFHRTGRRIQRVQSLTGRPADYSMGIHWVLLVFTGLWPLYSQHSLNAVWQTAQSLGGAPVVEAAAGPFSG